MVGNRGELRFFCRRRRLCRLLRRSCLAGKQVVERCLNGGTRVDGCSYAGWGLMERGCFGCCGFFCFFFLDDKKNNLFLLFLFIDCFEKYSVFRFN